VQEYLNIFIKAAFIENMALAYFLGMCSFLACSKKVETAMGLGLAVVLVQTITVPLNAFLYRGLLREGALTWLPVVGGNFASIDLSFLSFITFIGCIAASVQVIEMSMDKFAPALYTALGVFLPLITVNCIILAGSLFMQERDLNVGESLVFGAGSGFGWALAIVALAAVRDKLSYSNVPSGLRGLGMAFVITGLMAIGFLSFGGIQL
jgi:Na+-transporting NADH:ubiquinone oxidoreductase subunit E